MSLPLSLVFIPRTSIALACLSPPILTSAIIGLDTRGLALAIYILV